ncbi:thaumatin [Gongronella butleri]|nr:thaumatin [Gongronella butleri]
MQFLISLLFCGLVAGLPAVRRDTNAPFVTVKNSCSYSIVAGTSTNGNEYGDSTSVPSKGTHTFTYPSKWEGRVWARQSCEGKTCDFAGMWAPATLAEFHFDPSAETMYDISLVDGWNIPMSLAPTTITDNPYNVQKHCGTPVCSSLPSCPDGFSVQDNGTTVGCQSACSHFQTPEYCCTGAYDEKTCAGSRYAAAAKQACPDAYSYAYDDATSVYSCGSKGFTVEFCPS